ncbi:MAG: sensor histidine kinase [Calditrichia bacterium]
MTKKWIEHAPNNFVATATPAIEFTDQAVQKERLSTIGLLTAGVAHDFGNTITAISALAESSLRSVDDESPLRELLELIVTTSQDSAAYIEQLLSFSSPSSFDDLAIDVRASIHQVHNLVKRFLPGSLSIRLSLEDELPAIRFHHAHFQQVLLNLVLNARDAMGADGGIHLKAYRKKSNQYFRESHPSEYVCVAVKDSGSGIAPEKLRSIFNAHYSHAEHSNGSGLGLFMVKYLMEKNGGKITCNSARDEGSEFILHFPIVQKEFDARKDDSLAPYIDG